MVRKPLRLFALAAALLLCISVSAQAAGKASSTPTPAPREIPEEVVGEIPEIIQQVLDLAYSEMIEIDGANLKTKNKYTKWRNNYEFEWCGGFITWCMLQLDIPQWVWTKTPREEVPGIVHVKEAGVGKLVTGYTRMSRLSLVPQKGFIVVFGNGKSFKGIGATPLYHVGLVYDVQQLSPGKYRITTIEGNVNAPADGTHSKSPHTIRMYIRDYDMSAEKKRNVSLVPEEERTREENTLFSYGYTYENENLYINMFLMPWIPEESDAG